MDPQTARIEHPKLIQAAPIASDRDQGEEGGGSVTDVGPDAELIIDQHLGSLIDAQPTVQVAVRASFTQVLHQGGILQAFTLRRLSAW